MVQNINYSCTVTTKGAQRITYTLQNISSINKQQTTNNKQQTTNNKQQTTNNKQQTTNNKQQTTNNKQQTYRTDTEVITLVEADATDDGTKGLEMAGAAGMTLLARATFFRIHPRL